MSLYRTARPRWTLYSSDGRGRDNYISYNNGGFWKLNQYSIRLKPKYDYNRYSNFHSLYHFAAPFKYYSDGQCRDSYIVAGTGLSHDTKPLSQYQLTDFLRSGDNWRPKRPLYKSLAEKRINKQIKEIEKRMIYRLYTKPLLIKKEKERKMKEENDEGLEINENNEDNNNLNNDNDDTNNNIQYNHFNTENNIQSNYDLNKTDGFKLKNKKFKQLRINDVDNFNNELNKNRNKFLRTDMGFYKKNDFNPLKSRTSNNSLNKNKRVKLVKVYIESK